MCTPEPFKASEKLHYHASVLPTSDSWRIFDRNDCIAECARLPPSHTCHRSREYQLREFAKGTAGCKDTTCRIQTVSNWLVPYVFLLNATAHAFRGDVAAGSLGSPGSPGGPSSSALHGLRPGHPVNLALATAAAQSRESLNATIGFAEALLQTRRAIVSSNPSYDSELAAKFEKILAQAKERETWEKRTNEGAISTAREKANMELERFEGCRDADAVIAKARRVLGLAASDTSAREADAFGRLVGSHGEPKKSKKERAGRGAAGGGAGAR